MGAGVGAATDLKSAGGCGCSVHVCLGIPPEAQTRDGDVRQRDEVMMTNGEWQTTTATASLTTAGANGRGVDGARSIGTRVTNVD